MENKLNLEIKIISKETIKPSTPTPLHLNTFKLSLIDQIFPAFHIPLLLFYNNTPPNTLPPQITTLKSSLSHTLSQFYPLAGRCIDDSTVSCNDEGIPFFETHVNSRLTEFLSSLKKLDSLTQFLPPREFLALGPRPISELVPLALQINVFACGGVVIGCYMLHKFLDTSSLGTFFQYWAAIATQRYDDVAHPVFDATVKAFPPSPSMERVIVPDLSGTNDPPTNSPRVVVLVKSFRLTKTSITNLKAMAVSGTLPNPTSFETVAGFIWESVVAAACIARAAARDPVPEMTVFSITINMRSRTNPPIPTQSMGNCITDVQAKAAKQGTLPELVAEIHETVSKTKSKIEKFQGVNGVEELREDRKEASRFVMEDNANVYQVSSWCKLGLNVADFGFGKPNWIIPTDGIVPVALRNFIFFTDYYDDLNEGIEVWLFLEEKEMQVLETNPRFLEFASPC
ncbi:stemmadenine O-acetyltransferase-like [Silene latifolia]|uniref:stemmadenine O-acetyltransferase-like n=1 Tax=Silene latifolia TaxID=37657 RepID=UPI003D7816F7